MPETAVTDELMLDEEAEEQGRPTCRALKADGEPCRQVMNLSDNGLCVFHDPARTEELREMRSRGGKRMSQIIAEERGVCDAPTTALDSLDGVAEHLAWTIRAVEGGQLTAKEGRELAATLDRLRVALTDRDLHKKFRKLQKELADLKKITAE